MLTESEIATLQTKNNSLKSKNKYRRGVNAAFSKADVVRRALKEEQKKNAELERICSMNTISKKQKKKLEKKHKKGGGAYDCEFDYEW